MDYGPLEKEFRDGKVHGFARSGGARRIAATGERRKSSGATPGTRTYFVAGRPGRSSRRGDRLGAWRQPADSRTRPQASGDRRNRGGHRPPAPAATPGQDQNP